MAKVVVTHAEKDGKIVAKSVVMSGAEKAGKKETKPATPNIVACLFVNWSTGYF